MKSFIAIATTTWIRTEEEKKLVLSTLDALNSLNVPVVVVDRSSEEHKMHIRNLSNIRLFEAGTLSEQVLLAQRECAKLADYILYTQSDKVDFAKEMAQKMIEEFQEFSDKGMFIPVRTKTSIETYPAFQKIQEQFLNEFISDYIGLKNDYFAGPKIYPSSLVKYLDQLKGVVGWGIESFYYVLAKRLNMPFNFINCNITAPNDIDDERKTHNYRLEITKWQLDAFLQAQEVEL